MDEEGEADELDAVGEGGGGVELDALGHEGGSAELDAVDELGALLTAIMAIEARSMTGVLIKAHALAAWGAIEGTAALFDAKMHTWGPSLAADVMRVAASGAREAA